MSSSDRYGPYLVQGFSPLFEGLGVIVRLFTVAAGLTVVLFTGTACGGGSEPSATPGSSPSSASSAAGAGNTAEVCAEVKKLNAEASRTLTARMKKPIDDAIAGASEKEINAAFQKAVKKMKVDVDRWIDELKQQSDAAEDPALSTALNDLAAELAPLRTGEGSLQQMKDTVQKSQTDLAAYCGGAPAASSPTAAQAKGIGPGTACPGPVAFDTAEKWKPKAVSSDLLNKDGRTLLCEIDAKPAGILGFIRVWSVKATSARAAVKGVVEAVGKPTGLKYAKTTAGERTAIEVRYRGSEAPGRAFVVKAPSGEYVVVNWGGLDKEEHQSGLPAYELARSSLTVP
jgi:uncharacterized lipoprotein